MPILGNDPPDTAGPERGDTASLSANPILRVTHPSSSSAKLIEFLDRELRGNVDFSVRDEYPSVFAPYPGGESLFFAREGEVASHVAFTIREFLNPSFRFKIGLIGSVATSRRERGQGMASALLREAFSRLRARGCVLAVLWSDRPEFYRPLGFFRSGLETSYRFDPAAIPESINDEKPGGPLIPKPFELARHGAGVWRLYGKQPLRLDRSLEEMKQLCRVPRLRVFVTENEGVVSSYLAIHKGADFEDHVHEWGGDPVVVARAVACVQKRVFPDRPLTVIGPNSYAMEAFRRFANHPSRGALGLVKVIDRRALRSHYLEYLRSLAVSARWDEDLIVEGRRFAVGTDQEVLKIVLGNDDPTSDSVSAPPRLPFFLWGLDSI